MEVWSGNVSTSTGFLLGVKLVNRFDRQCLISKDSKLSIRCPVNPALIPLYARAGPSVELHTTNIETSQWLKTRLLSSIWLEEDDDDELERCALIQCPVGLLANVEGSNRFYPSASNVSDLLIYGVLSTPNTPGRPPSPPNSSSIGDIQNNELRMPAKRELRIYAAPLSTAFIQKAQSLPSPPLSPVGDGSPKHDTQFAQFLPDLRSPSPKRKRMSTLFEVAAQHHRRVRQRGGEAVSQLMANTASQSQTLSQLHSITVKKEPEEISNPALDRLGLRRARSMSLGGSLRAGKLADAHTEDPRPSTSKGPVRRAISKREMSHALLETKRSQSVAPSPTVPSFTVDEEPTSPLKDAQTIIAENKAVITRTILTCMRLYGFHRKANRSISTTKNNATASFHQDVDTMHEDSIVVEALTMAAEHNVGLSAVSSTSDEDEFKAMYYATYKASVFALRRYLKDDNKRPATSANDTDMAPAILSKEKVTNTVDGFLKLFCEDN